MRPGLGCVATLSACLLAGPVRVQAQSVREEARPDEGTVLYRDHCASCHGATGRGDGSKAGGLRVAPSDLTRLAGRSGGPYPADEVYRIIDGRRPVKGHGGEPMPVWGDAFKTRESGYSEQEVRRRIASLVRFLESIQKR